MRTRLLVAGLAATAALSGGTAAASPAVTDPTPVNPSIVGGRDATETYPWNVVWGEFSNECGGALIAPGWVLTAKHCTIGSRLEKSWVRIGSKDWSTGGESVKPVSWIKHPTLDVALMKLQTDASSPVAPIAALPPVGTDARLVGWGAMSGTDHQSPKTLQELDLKVVDNAQCSDGGIKGDSEFCVATSTGASGACVGDSGSPALQKVNGRWTLLGVTSRGPSDCGQGGSIYTSASAIAQWINENAGTSIPVPAPTSTPTATPTSAPTAAPTSTPAPTQTATPTTTATPTATPTSTPTATPTTMPPSAPGPVVMRPGDTRTGLSGGRGARVDAVVEIPAGRSATIATSGGTGDVDLYVKKGDVSFPTTTDYDCRPYRYGNAESCTFPSQRSVARYRVSLLGFSAFSGVTLRIS
ncbi:trypsin-like serine protease [Arsenicicoccus dermatophilus]|uniref:trypsin-like serine protease n=1 Tax=Arsenicicoccus dermatophilus TaxID=1076331 RepID=UPI0039176314